MSPDSASILLPQGRQRLLGVGPTAPGAWSVAADQHAAKGVGAGQQGEFVEALHREAPSGTSGPLAPSSRPRPDRPSSGRRPAMPTRLRASSGLNRSSAGFIRAMSFRVDSASRYVFSALSGGPWACKSLPRWLRPLASSAWYWVTAGMAPDQIPQVRQALVVRLDRLRRPIHLGQDQAEITVCPRDRDAVPVDLRGGRRAAVSAISRDSPYDSIARSNSAGLSLQVADVVEGLAHLVPDAVVVGVFDAEPTQDRQGIAR